MIIYALKLQSGKYWIGRAIKLLNIWNKPISSDSLDDYDNIVIPTINHPWTRMFSPIKFDMIAFNKDKYDEIKILLQYMDKYGISEVRGGPYVNIHLKPAQEKFLLSQLRSINRLWDVEYDEEDAVSDKSQLLEITTLRKCVYCHKTNCYSRYCPLRSP